MHHLVDLYLAGNQIRTNCCAAICELLTHPACILQTLYLGNNDNIDDECMAMLLNFLAKNNTIKHLILNSESNVTASGWMKLPDVLSNPLCAVEALFIGDNNFDDSTTWPLGHALCSNRTLKILNVSNCFEADPDGWRGLTEFLKSPDCALEELYMNSISVEELSALAVFSNLSKNNTLKKFSMADNDWILPEGWTNCFNELLRSRCVLEELDLSNNMIDDAGLSVLTHLLNDNLKLVVTLNLNNNSPITAHGWRSFYQVLNQYSNSNMKELHIGSDVGEATIDDSVIICLAKALEGNSKLTVLELGRTNISTKGWDILTKALCDISSIDDICYSSNHTLQKMTCSQDIPRMIPLFLQLNTLGKVTTPRVKLILFMIILQRDSVGRVFGLMPVSILPSAIAWMRTDRFGLSTLYSLVRSVPSLLENV